MDQSSQQESADLNEDVFDVIVPMGIPLEMTLADTSRETRCQRF